MGHKTHKKHGLTKEDLERMYNVELMSDSEIGKIYELTGEAVGYYRRKFNIKTMKALERIAKKAKSQGLRDIRKINADEFKKLHSKYSERVLAKMFGCSKILIRSKRKEFNIDPLNKNDRLKIRMPSSLSNLQFSIIYGSLLGDGGISLSDNKKVARFYETHGAKQLDYLKWKKEKLNPFSSEIAEGYKELEDGRQIKLFSFRTCYLELFKDFKDIFYKKEDEKFKKHLPLNFEKNIDPLSLAIWFMDDGSSEDNSFTLCSGFDKNEIQKIRDVLKRKFFIETKIKTQNESITVIEIIDTISFWNIIEPFIVQCIMYKVPKKMLLSDLQDSIVYPSEFDIDQFQNLNKEEKNRIILGLCKYYRTIGFPYLKITARQRRQKLSLLKNSQINLDNEIIKLGNTIGSDLCNFFFKNIWEAKRFGKKSPIEVFNDGEFLNHAISDCIKYRKKINDSTLRLELKTFGAVHNFRPAISKAIYDKYCPKNGMVLDPCSGYGGRLLGFYTSKNPITYYGIDANAETIKNLRHMKRIVSRDILDKKVKLLYGAFEDVCIPEQEQFDLIFTSPPYFNKEIYSMNYKQSMVRYKTYKEWLLLFIKTLIDKSYRLLKPEGYFIINIANIKIGRDSYSIADDFKYMVMNDFFGSFELETEYKMSLGSQFGKKERLEPIFVFRKKNK